MAKLISGKAGPKRVPGKDPKLPRLDPTVVDAIEKFLMDAYGMKRPPTSAAIVLALAVALHENDQAWPVRRLVAELAGCTVFGVDAALSVQLDRGLIEETVRTSKGNVQRRESIVRSRYYKPSQQLLAVVRSITRLHNRRSA